MGNHKKLLQFLRPDPPAPAPPAKSSSTTSDDEDDDDDYDYDEYYGGDTSCSATTAPATPTTSMSTAAASPYAASPWTRLPGLAPLGGDDATTTDKHRTGLLGSLVREGGGHVYSLAAAGDLLYTGTDSRNVRVWRDRRELGGFRSGSGLVKAIVVAADGRIYTGHQDGKVRVWRRDASAEEEPAAAGGAVAVVQHRRVGSLPRFRDVVRSALRPSQYVQTRRRHSALWMRHFDAVSSLSVDAAAGLIYSASWDRTFKVWRASDSKCLESVYAHTDAVNAVAALGFDALVLTGSADGTVKVWRRGPKNNNGDDDGSGKKTKAKKKGRRREDQQDTWHTMERVLREGDSAVTAIAVAVEARVVYVGSSDGAVSHWQWRRRRGIGAPRNGGALWGHKMAVLCVAVAGGRVVVSGSADRTICVWRREEGAHHARLAVLTEHTGPVKCVAMDQEETEGEDDADGGGAPRRWVVYSGSLDGSVKVWRVSDSDGGSGGRDLTTTTSAATTPARYSWKGSSPSPLRSWTPYAAATPEPRHMGAA